MALAANQALTPSIDSDVIHRLALQSDYVARYAELAEACRLVILRANAAATPDVGLTDIQAVLTDTIPRSAAPAPANADEDGTGAELTKNLIARSLNTAVAAAPAAATAGAAAPAGAVGGGGGGGGGGGAAAAQAPAQAAAQAAPQAAAPGANDPAILAQFKSIIKDHCSKALQKFRTFYNINKTDIAMLNRGIPPGTVDNDITSADLIRVFRRPQTGGKRTKKYQKKSKKSRK